MADIAPSRSAILDLRDERQTMTEGHAFLDEKCLVIAGEIVRELARYQELEQNLMAISAEAARLLQAAVARHGLEELAVHPAPDLTAFALVSGMRSVMGVKLISADSGAPPGFPALPAWSSPEARVCRDAFARLFAVAPQLGAIAGNLERLSEEYRRSIRRARALNEVLIPEINRTIDALETGLEDLEREDAIAMRLGARPPTAQ
jgi:V/A-type H+-transporting ATPase subunit D